MESTPNQEQADTFVKEVFDRIPKPLVMPPPMLDLLKILWSKFPHCRDHKYWTIDITYQSKYDGCLIENILVQTMLVPTHLHEVSVTLTLPNLEEEYSLKVAFYKSKNTKKNNLLEQDELWTQEDIAGWFSILPELSSRS